MSLSLDYIAGFFDAEGSFGVFVNVNKQQKAIEVGIGISQNSREVLDKIKNTLNMGRVSVNGYSKYGTKEFVFSICKREDCYKFVSLVKDKLFVKKEQAKIVQEILALIKDEKKGKKTRTSVSLLVKVTKLALKLRQLKAKGPDTTKKFEEIIQRFETK